MNKGRYSNGHSVSCDRSTAGGSAPPIVSDALGLFCLGGGGRDRQDVPCSCRLLPGSMTRTIGRKQSESNFALYSAALALPALKCICPSIDGQVTEGVLGRKGPFLPQDGT